MGLPFMKLKESTEECQMNERGSRAWIIFFGGTRHEERK